MSKLAKAIDAKVTRKVSSAPLKYMKVQLDTTEFLVPHYGRGTECRINVTIQKYAVVPEGVAVLDAIKDIKRAIIEDVFGEFRPLIYDMRAALYDDNKTDLRKLLGELEDALFHDGV